MKLKVSLLNDVAEIIRDDADYDIPLTHTLDEGDCPKYERDGEYFWTCGRLAVQVADAPTPGKCCVILYEDGREMYQSLSTVDPRIVAYHVLRASDRARAKAARNPLPGGKAMR